MVFFIYQRINETSNQEYVPFIEVTSQTDETYFSIDYGFLRFIDTSSFIICIHEAFLEKILKKKLKYSNSLGMNGDIIVERSFAIFYFF